MRRRTKQVLKPGRTQLREAVATTVGREFAAWSHAIGRDRWRCYKARERIREVNLGGTAIGTGAGAPRSYVLGVSRVLQRLVSHPITRAEHLGEATSNYDTIVEAMEAPRSVAVNLRRVAGDIRILASGPQGGIGELNIPAPLEGSSIMAGKRKPRRTGSGDPGCREDSRQRHACIASGVDERAGVERVFSRRSHTPSTSRCRWRSAPSGRLPSICRVLFPDRGRCARKRGGRVFRRRGASSLRWLWGRGAVAGRRRSPRSDRYESTWRPTVYWRERDADALFHPRHMVGLGYDEELCAAIDGRSGPALRAHAEGLRAQTKEGPMNAPSTTPRGLRPHICLTGAVNAGKSSLLNALTGHDLAIVSSAAGTTNRPRSKGDRDGTVRARGVCGHGGLAGLQRPGDQAPREKPAAPWTGPTWSSTYSIRRTQRLRMLRR